MGSKLRWMLSALALLPLLAACTLKLEVVDPSPTPPLEATVTQTTVDRVAPRASTTAETREPTAVSAPKAPTNTPTATPTAGPTPRPTPPPVLARGWEETVAHTVCLSVKQFYENVEEEHSEPVAAEVGRLLSGVGIEVAEDQRPCEATLTMTLTMEAIGANYSGDRYCYTGARAEGTATLAAERYPPITVSMEGEKNREMSVYSFTCISAPAGAPFEQAWLEAVLEGLGFLWGPEVPAQVLTEEEGWRRRAAIRALGELGPEAAPYLLRAPKDGLQHYERYGALCRIGPEIVPALGEALGDENRYVRWDAADALTCLGKKATAAIPQLIGALDDNSYPVRATAIEALGRMAPESRAAIPDIITALQDEQSSVRQQAVYALARFGPEAIEAVPALVETMADEKEYVRQGAIEALQTITGQDFGENADAWQAWWEERP